MEIICLKYSPTNTYLIRGSAGTVLFDTGWAGTFDAFCRELGEMGLSAQSIDHILISHFHPDHCGIAQDIAELGASVVVFDVQSAYVHSSDEILRRDHKVHFNPVRDESILNVKISESRGFLERLGILGEVLHTPGHSDDSISLVLDDGEVFVGDLNPLYELELHKGSQIEASWNMLLARSPSVVYYGHALCAQLSRPARDEMPEAVEASPELSGRYSPESRPKNADLYDLVSRIMKYSDKGYTIEKIRRKTGASCEFIGDVTRMYMTHTDVGVQGILDRIEIKNR